MKNKDVFIGTIKKCNNLYMYETCGEERYVGDFIVGHTEVGTTRSYTDVINNHAVLIKVSDTEYIWLKSLTSFKDELLVNLGIPTKVINTFPTEDNLFFVDEKTLMPYFENEKEKNKNVKVKSLKNKVLLDARILGGSGKKYKQCHGK